jgi:hypothetical protein
MVLDQLARRIGQVKSVEMNPSRVFEGNYVRVRAKIKVADPLVGFTPLNIKGEGRLLLPVKYEKIGFFCEVCGIMGHILEECGNGIHGPEEIEYGQWMVATRRSPPSNQFFQNNYSNPTRNRDGARRGRARGGGRGGANGARKRSSQDAGMQEDIDLDDTAQSPMKTGPVEKENDEASQPGHAESSVRKKLDLSEEIPAATANTEGTAGYVHGHATPPQAAVQRTSASVSVPPPPPPYVSPRDRKKPKKGTSPTKMTNSQSELAGSQEERRRAQ